VSFFVTRLTCLSIALYAVYAASFASRLNWTRAQLPSRRTASVICSSSTVSRLLFHNSVYYASGTRSSQAYTLTGITASSVMTAPAATSRQDQDGNPTVCPFSSLLD
jgi:hypothetical protein